MDCPKFADIGLMETRLSSRKRRRRRPPSAPPIGQVVPPFIFRNFPSSTCLAALVLLAFLVTAEASSGCRVDHCTRQFQQSALASGVRRGSPAFCVILRQYSDCLRSTARSCRGHLAYHSTITLVQNWNGDANCSYIQASKKQNHVAHVDYESPKAVPTPSASNHHVLEPTARVFSSSRPDKTTLSSMTSAPPAPVATAPADDVCIYRSSRSDDAMLHCSFYGDPHLVTFRQEFQTCKVAGAWPLIDNAYLAVSVTNEAVVPGSAATATTKITIIIKGGSDCAPERTYEAAVDSVPASFVDGSQWGGPASIPAFQDTSRPVRIVEKEPGRHVEIHARHLGAVLIVRQVGRYLTFAARVPRDIAEQGATREGLQLCVKGCPVSERIDVTSVVAGPAGRFHRQSGEAAGHRHHPVHSSGMHRDAALALCREYNLTDHYLDACMFDLMTTGDPSFSLAASRAQLDFHQLLPEARLANRTWPLTHSSPSSALQSSASSAVREAHAPGRPLWLALLLTFSVTSLRNSLW